MKLAANNPLLPRRASRQRSRHRAPFLLNLGWGYGGRHAAKDHIHIEGYEDIIKAKESARIEYVKLVDIKEVKDVKMISGETALAVAVFFSNTRLIDNATITVK